MRADSQPVFGDEPTSARRPDHLRGEGAASERCRVMLSAPIGEFEVSIPVATPVGEFMRELVAVGAPESDAAYPWQLAIDGGGSLGPDATLADSGIEAGAVLVLREAPRSMTADTAWPVSARTRIALPVRFSSRARLQLASRAARTQGGRDRTAPHLSRWQRARGSWTSSDYERRLDRRIASPRFARCVIVAVVAPEREAGATTVTALLGSLLSYLREDRVVALDANHAPSDGCLRRPSLAATEFDALLERGPDGLMLVPARTDADATGESDCQQLLDRLCHFASTLIVNCGTSHDAPLVHAALQRADEVVIVADGGPERAGAPHWVHSPARPTVLVGNRHEARNGLPTEALARMASHATGLITLARDDEAAALLRAGRFTWTQAPASWRTQVRELAALLAGGWPSVPIGNRDDSA